MMSTPPQKSRFRNKRFIICSDNEASPKNETAANLKKKNLSEPNCLTRKRKPPTFPEKSESDENDDTENVSPNAKRRKTSHSGLASHLKKKVEHEVEKSQCASLFSDVDSTYSERDISTDDEMLTEGELAEKAISYRKLKKVKVNKKIKHMGDDKRKLSRKQTKKNSKVEMLPLEVDAWAKMFAEKNKDDLSENKDLNNNRQVGDETFDESDECNSIQSANENEISDTEGRVNAWKSLIGHVVSRKYNPDGEKRLPNILKKIVHDSLLDIENKIETADPNLEKGVSAEEIDDVSEKADDLEEALVAHHMTEQSEYFEQQKLELARLQEEEATRKHKASKVKIVQSKQQLLSTLRFLCSHYPLWTSHEATKNDSSSNFQVPIVSLPVKLQRDFTRPNNPLLPPEAQNRKALEQRAIWSHYTHAARKCASLYQLLEQPDKQLDRAKAIWAMQSRLLTAEERDLGRLNVELATFKLRGTFPSAMKKLDGLAGPTSQELWEADRLIERLQFKKWVDCKRPDKIANKTSTENMNIHQKSKRSTKTRVSSAETQLEPTPHTQLEPTPHTQTEPRPDTQTEARPDTHTEARPDTQTETRPDTQTEPRQETQTEPKLDAQPDKELKTHLDTKSETRLETQVKPQLVTRAKNHFDNVVDRHSDKPADTQSEWLSKTRTDMPELKLPDGKAAKRHDGKVGTKLDTQTEKQIDRKTILYTDTIFASRPDERNQKQRNNQPETQMTTNLESKPNVLLTKDSKNVVQKISGTDRHENSDVVLAEKIILTNSTKVQNPYPPSIFPRKSQLTLTELCNSNFKNYKLVDVENFSKNNCDKSNHDSGEVDSDYVLPVRRPKRYTLNSDTERDEEKRQIIESSVESGVEVSCNVTTEQDEAKKKKKAEDDFLRYKALITREIHSKKQKFVDNAAEEGDYETSGSDVDDYVILNSEQKTRKRVMPPAIHKGDSEEDDSEEDDYEADEEEQRKLFHDLISHEENNVEWSPELKELHRQLIEAQENDFFQKRFTMKGVLTMRQKTDGFYQNTELTRRQKTRVMEADKDDEEILNEEAEIEEALREYKERNQAVIVSTDSSDSHSEIYDQSSSEEPLKDDEDSASELEDTPIVISSSRAKTKYSQQSESFVNIQFKSIKQTTDVKKQTELPVSSSLKSHPAFTCNRSLNGIDVHTFYSELKNIEDSASCDKSSLMSFILRVGTEDARQEHSAKRSKGFMERLEKVEHDEIVG